MNILLPRKVTVTVFYVKVYIVYLASHVKRHNYYGVITKTHSSCYLYVSYPMSIRIHTLSVQEYVQQAEWFKAANCGLAGLGLQSHFRDYEPPDATLVLVGHLALF